MRLHATSARRWTLGTVFLFVATALVAVFGITSANAAPRQVTGLSAEAVQSGTDTTTPAIVTTAPVPAPDLGEDTAPVPTTATAPEPVRPAAPLVSGAVLPTASDRASQDAERHTWGRAPPTGVI